MGLLWLTMLGALAATGDRRHIVIDLVGHFCPPRFRAAAARVTALFAAVVCGLLTLPRRTIAGFSGKWKPTGS